MALYLHSVFQQQKLWLRCFSVTSNYSVKISKPDYSIKLNRRFLNFNSSLSYRRFHVTSKTWDSVVVNCPAFAESITEGDVRWEKGQGDQVEEDETVAEVETDKTSIPIPSPSAGVIEALLVEEGTTVTPGTPLFKINQSETVAPSPPAPKVGLSGSEVEPEVGSEPNASSISIPDEAPKPPPIPSDPISSTPVSAIKSAAESVSVHGIKAAVGARSEHRVKMNRMRLRIAQRLKDSQNTAAMLTTFNEIDMSNIIAIRNRYKDVFMKKHGIKLSFMSAFIKASAHALRVRKSMYWYHANHI